MDASTLADVINSSGRAQQFSGDGAHDENRSEVEQQPPASARRPKPGRAPAVTGYDMIPPPSACAQAAPCPQTFYSLVLSSSRWSDLRLGSAHIEYASLTP